MNKTIVALALVVCVAAATTAVIYIAKSRQPAQGGDELGSADSLLKELEDFLDFENQEFDYNFGEISGDWG